MHFRRLVGAPLSAVMLIAVLLCQLVASPALAAAQSSNGRLVVTVQDATGAVVPGATVRIVNTETGQETTGTSTESGTYSLDQIQVGVYTVSIEAAGFQKKVAEGVKIDVGQEYSLTLQVAAGSMEYVETVVAGEELVKTTNAELKTTVSEKQVQDLPLNGRNPLELIGLQAGVNYGGSSVTHINGQRTSSTQITQDGINIQDNFIRANATDFTPNRTSVAQVAEFSVATQNAGVEASGAAVVQLVTPSGTNELHGSVFEYHRNDALAANDFFNNAFDVEKEKLIRNQFGFTIGGPVYVPKVYSGRDKLFFFGYYEGYRERAGELTRNTVLTPEARQGLFSYRDVRNPDRIITVDLFELSGVVTPDPFIANNVLSRVPNEINEPLTTSLILGRYAFNKNDPQDRNQGGGRLDYILNDNHRFEAVYNYTGEQDARTDIDTTFNVDLLAGTLSAVHFAVAAWDWTISPTLINEVRVGLNNSDVKFYNNDDSSQGFFLGLPLIDDPVVTFQPQGRRTITSSLIDSASWSRGAHFLRFGGELDRIRVRSYSNFGRLPTLNLGFSAVSEGGLGSSNFERGSISSADVANANALLALLGGVIDSASRTFEAVSQTSGFVAGAQNVRNLEINQGSWYVNDQWRVHPRVTVNAGVRWDYISPLREADNLALLPVLNGRSAREAVLDPEGYVDFVDGYYWNPDKNNFAPNVSIAWDVFGDGKTALRAGYSQAYINDEAIRAADNAVAGNAGLSQDVETGDIYGLVSRDAQDLIATSFVTPEFQVPRTYLQNFELDATSAAFAIEPNFQTPKYHQWNLQIDRELGWDTALSVRYVGNKGVDLARGVDYNQLDVINNDFAADVARARSNGFLSLAARGVFDPRYNANVPGSQQLTVFPLLASGGLLTNVGTIQALIRTGEAGTLAQVYYTNGLQGSVQFTQNPNTFVADVLGNGSESDYNALQIEVRRRFSRNLGFQANYTWSKALTDSPGTTQQKFDPFLNLSTPEIERARATYDIPHVFKSNFVYELPFGNGQWIDPENRFIEHAVAGWTVTSIFNWQTGSPFSILSNRGTLNRVGRSAGKNTANTSLTQDELNDLFGVFVHPETGELYWINPAIIDPDTGRGTNVDGESTFNGQVFFNPGPGELGTLQRRAFNGPDVFTWDLSFIKRTPITESVNLEIRAEFFNVLNHPVFFIGDQDINSINFGKIQTTLTAPRIIQLAAKINF